MKAIALALALVLVGAIVGSVIGYEIAYGYGVTDGMNQEQSYYQGMCWQRGYYLYHAQNSSANVFYCPDRAEGIANLTGLIPTVNWNPSQIIYNYTDSGGCSTLLYYHNPALVGDPYLVVVKC